MPKTAVPKGVPAEAPFERTGACRQILEPMESNRPDGQRDIAPVLCQEQHYITSQSIEGVGEVQLHQHLIWTHGAGESSCSMDCRLAAPRHTDSQLKWGEMCCESRNRITVCAFSGQPSPDVTNRDGPQAAIVLAKCYHIPAKQNGSNPSGASTAEQQVHEVSQGLNQRTTCIPKSHQVQEMARSKAVGATGRS